MGDFRLFLLLCVPGFALAGLASERNDRGALTSFESDEEGDSDSKNVTASQASPVWVKASNGYVPPYSVNGGSDIQGESLYVARINLERGLTPGKLPPSHKNAYASYGGLEIARNTYEVLTNPSGRALRWQPKGAAPPNGAIPGGNESGTGTLYIGRVRRPDGMHVTGKIHYPLNRCYIPFNGKEEIYTTCDILTLG